MDRRSPEAKHPTIMLHIDEHITDRDAVVKNWPIGLQVKSRLHPFERVAYPTSKWPFMTVPAFGLAALLLFLGGFQMHRLFERQLPEKRARAIQNPWVSRLDPCTVHAAVHSSSTVSIDFRSQLRRPSVTICPLAP